MNQPQPDIIYSQSWANEHGHFSIARSADGTETHRRDGWLVCPLAVNECGAPVLISATTRRGVPDHHPEAMFAGRVFGAWGSE
jgi:hypothetical protein